MDYQKYYWLNEDSLTFFSRGYLRDGQTVQQRVREIAETAERILKIDGFADKFEEYVAKGYYSLSTPVWTNYGNSRGSPVSCFSSYVPDSIEGMADKVGEVAVMSKMGGGTSGYFGDIRPRGSSINTGGKADGPVRYMEWFDATTNIVSQGSQRRGSFAAYLPVEHPDIMEFLEIREGGSPIQEMSIGVTITDEWMNSLISGDADKRKIWARIIKKRYETGYPYLFFTDTANREAPEAYKSLGKKILGSNLCNEIALSVDEDNSFVCVLSSINLLHWDEIVKTDAVETLIYFLDSVNEEFIQKSKGKKHLQTAHNFAKRERALGAGALGWHSYLQSKNIPFESFEAKLKNSEIFKTIRERAERATIEMAKLYGEPELLKGYGRRNVTTMAIAPTTSSSMLLGQVSPSIEPLNSNYFVKILAKGIFTYRNPFLADLLEKKGQNNEEVWKSILKKGGSVQHLDFLTQEEKDVYKTFGEISQKEIVIQASQRQKYIDQSQSLNLMIPPQTPPKEVSDLLIEGWKLGVKGFYYQRSANPSQELSRNINSCASCEG